jgi:hypothetical protein
MNHKVKNWLVGGLFAAIVLGIAFGVNSISNAAEKAEPEKVPHTMMQDGKMDSDMMNSPEMQKQCNEMMKSSELKKTI